MSITQVMQEVEILTPEERLQVQAFLVHLRRKDDPAHRADLKARLDAMQGGRVATEADLLRRQQPEADAGGSRETLWFSGIAR
jgi:hypothetical protein